MQDLCSHLQNLLREVCRGLQVLVRADGLQARSELTPVQRRNLLLGKHVLGDALKNEIRLLGNLVVPWRCMEKTQKVFLGLISNIYRLY